MRGALLLDGFLWQKVGPGISSPSPGATFLASPKKLAFFATREANPCEITLSQHRIVAHYA